MLTFYYFFILSVPFSNKTNKREKNNNELLVLLSYDRAVAAVSPFHLSEQNLSNQIAKMRK